MLPQRKLTFSSVAAFLIRAVYIDFKVDSIAYCIMKSDYVILSIYEDRGSEVGLVPLFCCMEAEKILEGLI